MGAYATQLKARCEILARRDTQGLWEQDEKHKVILDGEGHHQGAPTASRLRCCLNGVFRR